MSLVLDDIKNFIQVSETLNITRASEVLGITQPSLSYSIKRLELELGGEVFIRLKNGVQLSKLGEEFLNRSRKLLYEWEQVQNIANPNSGMIEGSYTFAIHPSVSLYTLSRFLPALTTSFPSLNYNFIHGLSREMTEKVISWEADFGIVVNPIRHPDLIIKKICHDEVKIFCTKNAKKRLIYDQNLAQTQYILKKFKEAKSFNAHISSANLEVVAHLTSIGEGYGVLPSRVAALYPNLKSIDTSPLFKDQICLVYRPDKHDNFISRAILDIIKDATY